LDTSFSYFEKPPELSGVSSIIEPSDPVNSPSHYNSKGVEAIAAIEASMSDEEYLGYLKGNCMKYMWRYKYKGKPVEDLKKAQWYLNKLIASVESM
tara:strand:+ start:965 stop:1252 length:288 start_codon:yes stop_codon:yes gene_type:complete